jgi:hypothetical protein
LHFKTQRLPDWRKAARQTQLCDGEISFLVFAHENDMRFDLVPGSLQNLLRFHQLSPTGRLAVCDQVNLLPQRQPVLENADGSIDRRKQIGRPIGQRCFADNLACEI